MEFCNAFILISQCLIFLMKLQSSQHFPQYSNILENPREDDQLELEAGKMKSTDEHLFAVAQSSTSTNRPSPWLQDGGSTDLESKAQRLSRLLASETNGRDLQSKKDSNEWNAPIADFLSQSHARGKFPLKKIEKRYNDLNREKPRPVDRYDSGHEPSPRLNRISSEVSLSSREDASPSNEPIHLMINGKMYRAVFAEPDRYQPPSEDYSEEYEPAPSHQYRRPTYYRRQAAQLYHCQPRDLYSNTDEENANGYYEKLPADDSGAGKTYADFASKGKHGNYGNYGNYGSPNAKRDSFGNARSADESKDATAILIGDALELVDRQDEDRLNAKLVDPSRSASRHRDISPKTNADAFRPADRHEDVRRTDNRAENSRLVGGQEDINSKVNVDVLRPTDQRRDEGLHAKGADPFRSENRHKDISSNSNADSIRPVDLPKDEDSNANGADVSRSEEEREDVSESTNQFSDWVKDN